MDIISGSGKNGIFEHIIEGVIRDPRWRLERVWNSHNRISIELSHKEGYASPTRSIKLVIEESDEE